MRALRAIFRAKGRMGAHALAALREESWLKISVVGTAGVLLWFGAYAAFARAFFWLQHEGFSKQPPGEALSLAQILMARMLGVFALALFFMLIFSNVLIAFSTMYKAREVKFLLNSPIGVRTFFLARFVECVSFSSWASAYLGTPMLLAYGLTTGAHWSYYLAAILFYVPFVTIPAGIGSIVSLVLARVFPRLPRVALVALAAGTLALFFVYLKRTLSAERLSEDTLVSMVLQATAQTQSPLLPSSWAAQGVLAAAGGDLRTAGFLWALLVANALMVVWLAAEAAHWLFLPGFSAILGGDHARLHPLGRGPLGRLLRVFDVLPDPMRALVAKDVRLFWRDPTQWTQFAIFFGIMAVYIANLGNRSLDLAGPAYRSWVASLNSGACALILASLTSRFVYPLISLEGFRFWILGLAPITRAQLVRQKFCLSVAMTTPFTLGLTALSCALLHVDAVHFAVSVYTIALANVSLAGLAVGLGSLYPNFEEDNPARIVSGMGGTLNFLLSVGYIALVIGSQMVILQWHVMRPEHDTRRFAMALGGVLVFNSLLSLAAALLPLRLGLRNLIATEF
jgi:ABC-2 type transport system permease protein